MRDPLDPASPTASSGPALRVYGALIAWLPADIRVPYGELMMTDFERLLRETRLTRGTTAARRAGLRGVLDLAWRVLVERRRYRRTYFDSFHGTGRRPVGGREQMLNTLREFAQALRALLQRPGYSAAAAITLALGIGATVSIFAVVDSVLLEPLPYKDSNQIVDLNHAAPGLNLPQMNASEGTFGFYREVAQSFETLAALGTMEMNLSGQDQPARVLVTIATPSLFEVLRAQPARGRTFTEEEAIEGPPSVIVLTDAAWRAYFGSDPLILERTVSLDGNAVPVIGVLPPGLRLPSAASIGVVPMHVQTPGDFGSFGMRVLGRLAPGATPASATAELTSLLSRLPERFEIDQNFLDATGFSIQVVRTRDRMVRDVQSGLWLVLGTVAFVFLIASANVTNLFIVRAEDRQREVAVRTALGASGAALVRSLLSENLLLSIAGGLGGLLLALVGTRLLVAHGPSSLPRLSDIHLGWSAVLLTVALVLVAGLIFGGLPAVRHFRTSFADGLKGAGRSTATRERNRLRSSLVVAQVALALVLLVGSGLMLRSFQNLRSVDLGFDSERVMTLGVSLGEGAPAREQADFYQRVSDRVAALPGVEAVGLSRSVPLREERRDAGSFRIESRPRGEGELPPVAEFEAVGVGFFEVLGIALVEGRGFERRDHDDAVEVAWVNQAFAQSFLDGRALGERITVGGADSAWVEIVGVVEDIRSAGVAVDPRPSIYAPLATTSREFDLSVVRLTYRAAGDPSLLLPGVRAIVAELDPTVPFTESASMEEVVSESMADTSFTLVLLGIAALVALLLGGVGVYGVISYIVSRRTQEIGVRMALGADPSDVRRMVVRHGFGLLAAGVGLGLLGALGLTRLMAVLLFGVSATDPATFVGVTLVMLAVGVIASYLPARRASTVSPTEALRSD